MAPLFVVIPNPRPRTRPASPFRGRGIPPKPSAFRLSFRAPPRNLLLPFRSRAAQPCLCHEKSRPTVILPTVIAARCHPARSIDAASSKSRPRLRSMRSRSISPAVMLSASAIPTALVDYCNQTDVSKVLSASACQTRRPFIRQDQSMRQPYSLNGRANAEANH